MATEIPLTEPPVPKRPRIWTAIKAAGLWLKNRRSARAVARGIAANQVATAALAASVAAAGVGGYGAVQARDAQNATQRAEHDVAGLKTRFQILSDNLELTRSNVVGLLARTAGLETKSAIQLRALGFRTSSVAKELSQLADQVAGMPSGEAQTAALAAQIAETASQAQRAMRKAEKAATAAAEADDDEFARAAASQAAVDAGLAAQQAAEAQRVAENARDDARYAPVVLAFPDGGPYERSFVLPADGTYTVTLAANGDAWFGGSTQGNSIQRGTQNLTLSAGGSHFNAYAEGSVTDASVTFTLAR